MSDKIIDLDLIDNSDENIFDDLMSAVERLNIQNGNHGVSELETIVLSIERKIQDLSDKNDNRGITTYGYVKRVLSEYTLILNNDNSSDTVNITREALSHLNFSIDPSALDFNNLQNVVDKLSIQKNLRGNISSLSNIKKAACIGLASLSYDTLNIGELVGDVYYKSWDIEMQFENQDFDEHKPLNFIYQFIEILSKIEDVKLQLEDIKKGSIIAKIKAYFKSEKSEKDVAEVLESARKFASGKLEKEFEEKEKLKSEKEKIDLEKQILIQQIETTTSLDALYSTALQIRHSEEDLKRKKLENLKLSLELLRDSRDTFSELLADGFVSQADFKILINEIPFLQKIDGKLVIGETPIIKKT